MNPLTVQLREHPRQRVDMTSFTPDRLAGKPPDAIARLPIWLGNRQVPAGELLAFTGEDTDHIILISDSDRLDGIGTGMSRGTILVDGHAGAYLGRQMRGGEIRVRGNAGAFAGSGMAGGLLRIDGDAGDFLGAAVPGERQGMRGGRIHVRGRAGDRIGDHLRRGMVLVEGDAGAYCASRMIAGTIVVLGAVGPGAGFAMQRGTVLLAREPELPPSFNDNGLHEFGFLALLANELRPSEGPFSRLQQRGIRVRRWLGDLACDGKGEVLVWS